MKIDRRSLLKLSLASAAAATFDFERFLWVPKPMVTVPALPLDYDWITLPKDPVVGMEVMVINYGGRPLMIGDEGPLGEIGTPIRQMVSYVGGGGERVRMPHEDASMRRYIYGGDDAGWFVTDTFECGKG